MSQRILVVDDDPVIGMLVSEYLQHHGHHVEVLASGALCLQRLRSDSPDVLVLDMLMPDMNGQEVLRQLRADPKTAKIPVIMLSADRALAGQAGLDVRADCYLQKPFDIKDFLRAIDAVHAQSSNHS